MEIRKKLQGSDGSVKYLFQLKDGNSIETLYMHDMERKLTYHSTVCVSSQAGCSMGCRFCATGEQGFVRNLEPHEISGQVKICDEYRSCAGLLPLDAVVFAGMGEPLLNYEGVKHAMYDIESRFGISHFELATVGIVPRIYDLIRDFNNCSNIHIRLNLSLHGSFDAARQQLIPLTTTYGVKEIIKAAADYAGAFNSNARIRYMLIKDLNDTDEDISRLIRLLEGKPLKLILSRYNENGIYGLSAPEPADVVNFYNKIKDYVQCEIFHNFGEDIQGGCGQLRRSETGARQ